MSQKIEFQRILPSCLHFIPDKAVEYLEKSVKASSTSDLTVTDAIIYCKKYEGDIYLALDGENICGTAFFMYGKGNNGKILDAALLGGDGFIKYSDQAISFLKTLAKSKDCKEIWIMGRKGWGKIFPESRVIGYVFSLPVE